MIAVPIVIAFLGLTLTLVFAFDMARVATRLARVHEGYAHRFPRYYAVTDRLSLSSKPGYWRWFGGLFGSAVFVLGTLTAIAVIWTGRP